MRALLTPAGPRTNVGNSVRATVLQGDRGTDAYYRVLTSHLDPTQPLANRTTARHHESEVAHRPLVAAFRGRAFVDSIASVVQTMRRISVSNWREGAKSAQAFSRIAVVYSTEEG